MVKLPDLCNYCCCCCCAGVAPPKYVPYPDPVCLQRRLLLLHVLMLLLLPFLSYSCQCCCCCWCYYCSGISDYHLTCVLRDLNPQNSVLYGRYAAPAATVVAVAVAVGAADVAAVVDYHRNKVKNSHRNHHHALWVCCQVSDILTLLCLVFSSLSLLLSLCLCLCVFVVVYACVCVCWRVYV